MRVTLEELATMPGDLTGNASGAKCRSLPASSESTCSSTEVQHSKLAGQSQAAILSRVAAIARRIPVQSR
jgi:hypothetical protein